MARDAHIAVLPVRRASTTIESAAQSIRTPCFRATAGMRSPPRSNRPVASHSCADRSLGSDRTFPAPRHHRVSPRAWIARPRRGRPRNTCEFGKGGRAAPSPASFECESDLRLPPRRGLRGSRAHRSPRAGRGAAAGGRASQAALCGASSPSAGRTCFRTFRASASVLRQPDARPCIRDRTESSMWSMWRPTDDQVREFRWWAICDTSRKRRSPPWRGRRTSTSPRRQVSTDRCEPCCNQYVADMESRVGIGSAAVAHHSGLPAARSAGSTSRSCASATAAISCST